MAIKLTESKLRQIIREEVRKLSEIHASAGYGKRVQKGAMAPGGYDDPMDYAPWAMTFFRLGIHLDGEAELENIYDDVEYETAQTAHQKINDIVVPLQTMGKASRITVMLGDERAIIVAGAQKNEVEHFRSKAIAYLNSKFQAAGVPVTAVPVPDPDESQEEEGYDW